MTNNGSDGSTPAPDRPRPNTFHSIDLDPQTLAALPFASFVKTLLERVERLKRDRFAFYEGLRRRNSSWANGARAVLAILGAFALLLTALASGIRLAPKTPPFDRWADLDQIMLLGVLIVYAVMGAISFYEKGSDKTTAYFRQIATVLAIRDLWTKLQFDVLKELIPLKNITDAAAEDAARHRILTLGQTFCAEMDKIATGELAEFRTRFQESIAELDAASKKGLDDTTKVLEQAAKDAEKAAAEAKAAAEKAANDAKAAAKVAEDAAKPGFLNISVVGEFDDEVVISVAGAEVARSRGKLIAVERVTPGPTKIAAQAKKGAKALDTSLIHDVKPGVQDVRVNLS